MPLTSLPTPPAFLTVRVELDDGDVHATTLCAGFERGAWRQADFVGYLFSYLLEFAFKWSVLGQINSATASRMIEEAARKVYATPNFSKRGEFGELLLHAALRNHFGSESAVAKIFYKSGDNDTVKGFDCVHVVENEDAELELWLGEAKFYARAADAVRDALISLASLIETERLKREFAIVRGHVDDNWPYAAQFRALTEGKSLDEVFPILCLPILLTYDSPAVGAAAAITPEYQKALAAEVTTVFERLKADPRLPREIHVHLILVPLKSKETFLDALHERLLSYQAR